MIDLHTHILPGIDDGSKSLAQSLEMLRLEKAQGVTEVVLTPHYYPGESNPQEFLRRRGEAWQLLESALTPDLPKLRLGAEVQYFEGICNVPQIRDLRVQDTKLLLLEMPFGPWSSRMVRDVVELNQQPGVRVVLAHIERYLRDNAPYLEQLLDRGVLLQANVAFFCRWQTRSKAVHMLKAGQLRFLGSDCHDMKLRPPNWDELPDKVRQLLASRTFTV